MIFLLNMNVPRELGRRLGTVGHQFRHVGDIGMTQANDSAIVEEARAHKEVIVTHDLDSGTGIIELAKRKSCE
jgi:predicted nuclease of predicted toxin-antitoxin system